MLKNTIATALIAALLAGCATTGSEGMRGNQIDFQSASPTERRAAVQAVRIAASAPVGMTQTGTVSTRRCHRNFTEVEPSAEALTADLQVAAYAKGGDAIVLTGSKKVNGLAANCWYVIEASAVVYQR